MTRTKEKEEVSSDSEASNRTGTSVSPSGQDDRRPCYIHKDRIPIVCAANRVETSQYEQQTVFTYYPIKEETNASTSTSIMKSQDKMYMSTVVFLPKK